MEHARLNTYESEVVPGIFITVPSATASSTIAVVEGLDALRLRLCKHAYRLPEELWDAPFVVSVLTQIVDKGYALHGRDDWYRAGLRS